ncbi:hypothetical protein diail_7827, partial [Diaporthe ilicicola]
MKFLLVAAAVSAPFAMASPFQSGHSANLFTRDKPKLKQYQTLDDCKHDQDILYHATPVLRTCYDLDGQTGAVFDDTAGFLHSTANMDIGCNGDSTHVKGGKCVEK